MGEEFGRCTLVGRLQGSRLFFEKPNKPDMSLYAPHTYACTDDDGHDRESNEDRKARRMPYMSLSGESESVGIATRQFFH